MKNEQWVSLFQSFPELTHPQLVVQLQTGVEICIDSIVLLTPYMIVIRGRLGGTTDEGRGYFIPYEQLAALRWEKALKLADLQRLLNIEVTATASSLDDEADARENAARNPEPLAPSDTAGEAGDSATITAAPNPNDTKSILEKIRAMRASGGPPNPKGGNK